MNFDDIQLRMRELGVDRTWLAAATDYTPAHLANILAPNGDEKSKTKKALRRIWEALDREESARKLAAAMPSPLGYRVFIEPTEEQFDRWMAAAYSVPGRNFDHWSREGLDALAAKELTHLAGDPGTPPAPVLNSVPFPPTSGSLVTFPEIPLIHAAAGAPIVTDGETYHPTRDHGPGRFACQLHGDSMAPRYPDGSTVILRDRATLKRPVLKNGEIYLFSIAGEKTLKTYASRLATKEEIAAGQSYVSTRDGKTKTRVLRSINPEYPEIIVAGEVEWTGWLDPKDNPKA